MKKLLTILTGALMIATTALAHPKAQVSEIQTLTDLSLFPVRICSTGGAFFYPPKGTFTLSVMKTNPGAPRTVRAILFSPDREVLADVWMPGDEKSDRFQKVDISVEVPHPGVYGLCITACGDRYGQNTAWGFATNCEKYLIETSRGHKDRRHEEPIIVASGDHPGDIFFAPSTKPFSLELTNLPKKSSMPKLLDDQGKTAAAFTLNEQGQAVCQLGEDKARKGPWCLHLPAMQVELNGDHVTRWDRDSILPNAAIWTDKRSSWFDYITNRHLLLPYNHQINIPAGKRDALVFTLKNYAREPKTVQLALEYDKGMPAFATLSATQIELPARCKEKKVSVMLDSVKGGASCRLRATTDGFTTYSTIRVNQGAKDRDYAIQTPLYLTPYIHENQLASFNPDYPTPEQPFFDLNNTPYLIAANTITSLHDGKWVDAQVIVPGVQSPAVHFDKGRSVKIAFDKDNWAYTIADYNRTRYLAYSSDNGLTFKLLQLPKNGGTDIEVFTGHNMPPGPPPIVINCSRNTGPRERKTFWRSENDMYLVVPVKKNGELSFLPPIHVTKLSLGLAQHSGVPTSIASFGDKTHIIWCEATDPDDASIPGVPTFVATYDHKTRKLSSPVLIGYGPPANDVHNTPCITLDSKGYLHALVGTHGRTFKYARSLKPNSSQDGWTTTIDVGENLGQTYIGMICDKHDMLHTVFRLWGDSRPDFKAGSFAQLATQHKPAMEASWPVPEILISPPFTDYSVFYHRLSIDRKGTLYLSYIYWSTYWFYRNESVAARVLLSSEDEGKSWRLVSEFK